LDRLQRSVKQTIFRSGREIKNAEKPTLIQCFTSCLKYKELGFGDVLFLLIESRIELDTFFPLNNDTRKLLIYLGQYLGRYGLLETTGFNQISENGGNYNQKIRKFQKWARIFVNMFEQGANMIVRNAASECSKSCGIMNRFFSQTFYENMQAFRNLLDINTNISSPIRQQRRGTRRRVGSRRHRSRRRV
jgi:hypothetical protein